MIRDTLLIIDDSELDLAILNEIFKNLFRVECILDARHGRAFLNRNRDRVCAILLDICLERQDAGFAVLRQLQGDSATTALPVILITTDAHEAYVRTGVELGAVDFLVKPVNPHTVQERVCSVVRSAWPPNSTILDRKLEVQPQPSSSPEPQKETCLQLDLGPEGAQTVCREWSRKLESFCQLRPGLDMPEHRQLGAITALLAKGYARQFPDKGLTQEDAALIGAAAVFCDIGLLGVPDRAIEEGEEQDGPDAQLYYQHTKLGHDLFLRQGPQIPLLRYAAEIALWHHKNADGSGYPKEEDGTAIPISAQLTRTALRIQHYLRYYRGCTDNVERMLRTLKSEAGVTISPELYQVAEQESRGLQSILQST